MATLNHFPVLGIDQRWHVVYLAPGDVLASVESCLCEQSAREEAERLNRIAERKAALQGARVPDEIDQAVRQEQHQW